MTQWGGEIAVREFATRFPGSDRSCNSSERHDLSEACWWLLDGYIRHRMEDGTIMLPDSALRWHALMSINDEDIIALAGNDRSGGGATLSTGLYLALHDAAAGLWCDPQFLRAIGDVTFLVSPPFADGVPLGLEHMASKFVEAEESTILDARAKWLEGAVASLCPDRKMCLRLMLRNSTAWIWAHEIGHLILGHHLLDDLPSDLALINIPAPDQTLCENHGRSTINLEIQADDFAAELLLKRNRLANSAHIDVAVMGGVLALSLFEAQDFIRRIHQTTVSHPGGWFRASTLLQHADGLADSYRRRLTHISAMASAMRQCGQWLGIVISGDSNQLARLLREEAACTSSPRNEHLLALKASLLIDTAGVSTDFLRV